MGQCPHRPFTHKSPAHHQTDLKKRESAGTGRRGKEASMIPFSLLVPQADSLRRFCEGAFVAQIMVTHGH